MYRRILYNYKKKKPSKCSTGIIIIIISLIRISCRHCRDSYAIFSLGDLHGTSSSSSSSLSSPSSSGCGTDMFNDEPVMVSATGNILGRRLPVHTTAENQQLQFYFFPIPYVYALSRLQLLLFVWTLPLLWPNISGLNKFGFISIGLGMLK